MKTVVNIFEIPPKAVDDVQATHQDKGSSVMTAMFACFTVVTILLCLYTPLALSILTRYNKI